MIFHRFINFFTGTIDCLCAGEDTAALIGALRTEGISVFYQRRQRGMLRFSVRRSQKNALDRALAASCVNLCGRRDRGLPQLLYKYRLRPGLIIGAVIYGLLLFISSRFIWDIRVEGNDTVPDSEIIALLQRLGCEVGSYSPAIDYDSLCNKYLATSDNIAWISVNLTGTVAYAEVIESAGGHANSDNGGITASNLVAERDGVVVSYAVIAGQSVVKPGAVVSKGELLVSGLISHKNGSATTVGRAQGAVYAKTRRVFTAVVPLVREQKVATSVTDGEKFLKFFSTLIKISLNSSNLPASYDKIVDSRRIVLPGDIELPVFIISERLVSYTTVPYTLTEEEASRLAWDQVYTFVDTELADCELISADISEGKDTYGVYRIKCVFGCLENIATERVIGVGSAQTPSPAGVK